jgi:hypothetical protein
MEKFFLSRFFACDELDVVDQQDVDGPIPVAEAGGIVLRMALIRSFVNSSEETYSTVIPRRTISLPMACSKWVFPRPTPP